MSEIGHNSGASPDEIDALMDDNTTAPQALNSAAAKAIRNIVQRVERLEEEKKEIAGQIKEVYSEAKAFGLDTKALRALVRIRKQDAREREEAQMILDLYLDALGDLA